MQRSIKFAVIAGFMALSVPAYAYDPNDYTTITLPNGRPFTYLTALGTPTITYDSATQTATLHFVDGTEGLSGPTSSSASSGGSANPETFDAGLGGSFPTAGSTPAQVPEPEVAGLFAAGALGLTIAGRRRRRGKTAIG